MHDFQAWTSAGHRARSLLERMEGQSGFSLLAERIMALKEELLGLALSSGSGEICRTCGGECCLHGKYHLTLLDLMMIERATWRQPLPRFGTGACCPYGGATGCDFEPRLRPMTCVVFNCDLVERQLDPGKRGMALDLERELRGAIAAADSLAGTRLSRPALLVSD